MASTNRASVLRFNVVSPDLARAKVDRATPALVQTVVIFIPAWWAASSISVGVGIFIVGTL
jgi:hypothetical protein